MRRRLLGLFVAAFVLTLGAVAFFSLRGEREPEYQGRKLSEWVDAYSWHGGRGGAVGESIAQNIRLHFGTNAIPWLIKWSLYREPGWQKWLEEKLPNTVTGHLHLVAEAEPQGRGRMGFTALGDAAAPAIPALIAIIDDPARSSEHALASRALSCIGRAAVPALLQTMRKNGPKGYISYFAIWYLSNVEDLGTNREEAGELLRAYVSGADASTASISARALGMHRLQPALSVPVLAAHLDKSPPPLVIAAASALAGFGPDAKVALPKLAPLLTNRDEEVRTIATTAFAKIAPQDK